ncbi:MAG: M50 family metallopeptidase [Myxococcaceae bacterium]|nr:M50 family metallopeptidase [Myxococcaceae bacterium]MCI0669644.1 M50 family metallopeptidase [Myxococcaceae bacterium]
MSRREPHPETPGAQRREGGVGLALCLLGAGALGVGALGLALVSVGKLVADLHGAVLLALLPLAVFVSLLAHELGHVLGGRVGRLRFAFLVLGPFEVRREGTALHLRLNRHLILAGGTTVCVPEGEHALRARWALFSACGPVANLALGVGALLAGRSWGGVPGALLGLTALVSLGLALVTLLPLSAGGLTSDGARLLVLLRGGPEAERWCAMSALTSTSMAGVRPRDWSASLVALATAYPDGEPDDVSSMLLAYTWALDRGAPARAELHLVRALELVDRLPEASRPAVALEGAFLAAHHQGDASVARAWLDRGDGGVVAPHVRRRATAAVLLAEGRPVEALHEAEEGLRLVVHAADAGGARMDREWLEALQRRARSLVPDVGDRPPPSAGEGTARA